MFGGMIVFLIPYANQYDSIHTGWYQFPDSVPITGITVSAIAVSTSPAHRLYYGTSSKELYRIDNADVGTPVVKNITYSSFPAAYITCIAVDPLDADKMLVVFSNYNVANLFYSSDGGTTWSYVSGNLHSTNGPSLRWATFMHPSAGGTIYWVATSTGVYATDSLNGTKTTWVQQGASTIGNSVCNMIDVRPSDGLVTVATHTHGIYSAYVTNVNQVATVHNLTDPVSAMQLKVYPNPSSGTASISFTLPQENEVSLKI